MKEYYIYLIIAVLGAGFLIINSEGAAVIGVLVAFWIFPTIIACILAGIAAYFAERKDSILLQLLLLLFMAAGGTLGTFMSGSSYYFDSHDGMRIARNILLEIQAVIVFYFVLAMMGVIDFSLSLPG